MSNSTFEIDLLDFHGKALELDFQVLGAEADWLLDEDITALKLDPDEVFRAELRAQLIGSTVHISGYLEGGFHFQCGRCMEWRRIDLDEEVQFVLMSRPSWEETYGGTEEVALSADDLDVSYYDEEIIDLRPLIREAVLLELPSFPTCSEENSHLCDEAYERAIGTETIEENEASSIDLRWSKLKELSLKKKEDSKS